METYAAAARIAAPADRIWAILADLAHPAVLEGFCESVHVDGTGNGALRTFRFEGGTVSERIERFDPARRSYAYHLVDIGPIPCGEYEGRLEILAAGPDAAVLSYTARYVPIDAAFMHEMVRKNFATLIQNLEKATRG
jgi:Polyketide cyclase / dehydrase and lipid transport